VGFVETGEAKLDWTVKINGRVAAAFAESRAAFEYMDFRRRLFDATSRDERLVVIKLHRMGNQQTSVEREEYELFHQGKPTGISGTSL
jgi:hypothetical protein